MLFSKRSQEGFLCIDHRDSPGFTPSQADAGARGSLLPYLGKGQVFKSVTNTCSHCDRVVVKNPLRTRERGHCPQCDYFVCDPCMLDLRLTDQCHCRAKRIDLFLRLAPRGDS